MLIKQKVGNIRSYNLLSRFVDLVEIDWFEAGKRILHKQTKSGVQIVAKFLNEPQSLEDGDILWLDNNTAIVVDIQPCEAIVLRPKTMSEMAAVCYEIGNKHLPLFYNNEELLVPCDVPLLKLLQASGYQPKTEIRKLVNQVKTTVSPHASGEGRQTLFSKILQLTTPS